MKKRLTALNVAMAILFTVALLGQGNIHSPGEGGVFTPDRLALLKSDRGELAGLGNNPGMINLYSDMRIKLAKMGEEIRLTLDDIEGTIYLDEGFKLATLYDKGVAFRKLHMRYDAYNDELELKEAASSKKVQALVKNENLSCSLNGDKLIFSKMQNENGAEQNGYLILKYEGVRYTLFQRKAKLFKEGKLAKTSHGTSFPHRFVDQLEYYVAVDGGTPRFLKAKKSNIVSMFGEKNEPLIKKFIKDKRLNITEQNDLVDLFAFVNQLE